MNKTRSDLMHTKKVTPGNIRTYLEKVELRLPSNAALQPDSSNPIKKHDGTTWQKNGGACGRGGDRVGWDLAWLAD